MSYMASAAILIDSDEHVRSLMKAKIEAAGLEIAAERAQGIAAQQAVQEMLPLFVFIAVEQPIQRAMQTIEFARSVSPETVIVAYSGSWSPIVERRLMQAGVNDFLHGKVTREQLKAIVNRPRRRSPGAIADDAESGRTGRVVAVIGQKGGIGKTTTSTNLAAAIALEGRQSVLLIDLDTRFGDVAVMMDIRPDFTVSEIARDPEYLDRDAFRSVLLRHESGAFVLPAPRDYRSWLNCSPEQLQDLIRFAATMFDVVILDTPGTFNDVVGAAVELADRTVVVTSTDLSSLKNTSLLVEHLDLRGVPSDHVIVSLIHGHDVGGGPERADVEFAISRKVDFEVPFDRAVRKASQLGVPVVMHRPNSPAAVAFGGIAGAVGGFSYAYESEQVRRRFFRVFGPRKAAPAGERKGLAV